MICDDCYEWEHKVNLCDLHKRTAEYKAALGAIRDECHPKDLKDCTGMCSGCVAERALDHKQ
jgi:hypothetical protein